MTKLLIEGHDKNDSMKGEAISMKSNPQLKFTDEMLHFLYSSSIFQSLTEEEQLAFLQKYKENETFHKILQVAIRLNELIEEVELTMLPISENDANQYFKQSRRSITERVTIEDNVYHFPFGERLKEQGPFIVCIQQGSQMEEVSLFCKGMLLPLFDMCYRQQRDLIVLLFSDDVEELRFEYGQSPIRPFDLFISMFKKGDAKIIPVLEHIITLWDEADIKDRTEVMLVTNNELADYSEENVMKLIECLKERSISITAVAMSEQQYEKQPMHFLDNIFFVYE